MRRRRVLQGAIAGMGAFALIRWGPRPAEALLVHYVVGDAHQDDFAFDGDGFARSADFHSIERRNPDGSVQWKSGGFGAAIGQLNYPKGYADSARGDLVYVADTGNHHVDVFGGDGAFKFQFGGKGTGNGQMLFPNDVAVDPDGFVFVSDTGNHRIQAFALDGTFVQAFGAFGLDGAGLNGPTALALHPDRTLHVVDTGNARVQTFSIHGDWHGAYASRGTGIGQLQVPRSIAIDSHGRSFVGDRASWLITTYGPNRGPYERFQPRFADGSAAVPLHLATRPDDVLYVTGGKTPQGFQPAADYETPSYLPITLLGGS
jgi:DNA-binding beta-propeller fold protein YncE